MTWLARVDIMFSVDTEAANSTTKPKPQMAGLGRLQFNCIN